MRATRQSPRPRSRMVAQVCVETPLDTVIRRNSHALRRTETTCHDRFNAPSSPLFPTSSLVRPPPLPETLSGAFGVSNLSDTAERGAPRARVRPIRVPSASPGQWQTPHCCPILSNGALRSNNRAGERLIESLAAPGNWGPAVRSVRRAPRGDAAQLRPVPRSGPSVSKRSPGSDFRRKGWTAPRSEGVRQFGHGDWRRVTWSDKGPGGKEKRLRAPASPAERGGASSACRRRIPEPKAGS